MERHKPARWVSYLLAALAAVRGALGMAVALLHFAPWHRVYETDASERWSLLFTADRGGPAGSGPADDTGVTWVCTGYTHYDGSLAIPLVALALALVGALAARRRGAWHVAALEVSGIVPCVAFSRAALFWYPHQSCRLEYRLYDHGSDWSPLGLVLVWALGPVVQGVAGPQLYAGGRRLAP